MFRRNSSVVTILGLLLFSLIAVTSCEKDDDLSTIDNTTIKQKMTGSQTSLSQIKRENHDLFNFISDRALSIAKSSNSSNGTILDTTHIQVLEGVDFKNYIFKVTQDSTTISNELKNYMLVILKDSIQHQYMVTYPYVNQVIDTTNVVIEPVFGTDILNQVTLKCGGGSYQSVWVPGGYVDIYCQGGDGPHILSDGAGTGGSDGCKFFGGDRGARRISYEGYFTTEYVEQEPCETIDPGNPGNGGGGTPGDVPPPPDDNSDDDDDNNVDEDQDITVGVTPNDGAALDPPSNEQSIENNFDVEDLDECSSEILNKLKNNVKSDMADILEKLGGSETVYTTKFESGDYPQYFNNAFTNWKNNSYSNFYQYDIKIQNHHRNSATDLGIAQTLLHELTHAYFLSLIDDCRIAQNCAPLQSYPQLWQYYVELRIGTNPNSSHHNLMADLFVKTIASALQEFHTGVPIPEGVSPDELYRDLAWSGLEGTAAWDTLTPTEQIRISKRITAEDFNQPQYDLGGQQLQYYPQGQLCD